MRRGLLALWLAIAVIGGMAVAPRTAAAAPGDIAGSLPAAGGTGIVVWGGGTAAEVRTSAAQLGCDLGAAWYLDSATQMFAGYVYGAPAIVNASWDGRFTTGVPAGTLLILSCRFPAPAVATPGPGVTTTRQRELALQITTGINQQRASRGLPALAEAPRLVAASSRYAAILLDAGRLNHEIDGTEPWDRAFAAGYPTHTVGEVLASRSSTVPFDIAKQAATFVQMWMDSPPHRAILMGDDIAFREIGVACALSEASGTALYCAGLTGVP